jgi:diadenosine tetraphosphate (Ap4A) HIT family hydrolase
MENWKKDRIGSCERGENPTLILKMRSGFAVIADHQFLPGYCVLLGYPMAESLNELPIAKRMQYLTDMSLIGDAIIKVCNPLRVNYATLMNQDHYLHTHIEARYDWEPDEFKQRPAWFYPREQRYGSEVEFHKFGELKSNLTQALKILMNEAYGAGE